VALAPGCSPTLRRERPPGGRVVTTRSLGDRLKTRGGSSLRLARDGPLFTEDAGEVMPALPPICASLSRSRRRRWPASFRRPTRRCASSGPELLREDSHRLRMPFRSAHDQLASPRPLKNGSERSPSCRRTCGATWDQGESTSFRAWSRSLPGPSDPALGATQGDGRGPLLAGGSSAPSAARHLASTPPRRGRPGSWKRVGAHQRTYSRA
jgi:hypothetical protein